MKKLLNFSLILVILLSMGFVFPHTVEAASLKKTKVSYTVSANKASLTFKKVSGVTGYKIYRSTEKGKGFKLIKTTKSTKYTTTIPKYNKTYYYKVKTYKGKKLSSFSNVIAVKAYNNAKINSCTISGGKATLNFKKATGMTGYKVYRSTKSGSGFKLIKTTKSTKYTTTVPTYNKTYYYKIKTYKGNVLSSFSNRVAVKVSDSGAISKANYNKLKEGMTYAQVTKTLGSTGKLYSSEKITDTAAYVVAMEKYVAAYETKLALYDTDYAAWQQNSIGPMPRFDDYLVGLVKPNIENYKTTIMIYQYKGKKTGSVAAVGFVDGKLVTKNQKGLT